MSEPTTPTPEVPARVRYAVLVIWSEGEEEYLREGDQVAQFRTPRQALELVKFMRQGMDGVQSINVVRYPEERRRG